MRKLLRANFARLWKSRTFWVEMAFMALICVAFLIDNRNNDSNWTLDGGCFNYAFFVPILTAIVTALYVGSEYSDGTMRNKCVIGHQRKNIYLANLIVCMTASTLLCAAYLMPYLCLGRALQGHFQAEPQVILLYAGLIFVLMLAFAALFVLAAMLCQSKAHSATVCILLAFALLVFGFYITSELNEPEYYEAYSATVDGITVSEPEEPNPHYVSGTKRQVYEFLQEFTPGGQLFQVANMDAEHPARLALYSSAILLLSTCCGIVIFRRKDLK